MTQMLDSLSSSPTLIRAPQRTLRSKSAHNSMRDALSADEAYNENLIRDFLAGRTNGRRDPACDERR